MQLPSLLPFSTLALRSREKGVLEPDWIGLWEMLSIQGPAILLESGGMESDAGQWTFLAGQPQFEVFGTQQECRWVEAGKVSEPRDPRRILGLLDQMAADASVDPFPLGLGSGWFGTFGYEFSEILQDPWAKKLQRPAEPIGRGLSEAPDYHFFKPGVLLAYNRAAGELFSFGGTVPEVRRGGTRDASRLSGFVSRNSKEQYEQMVRKAQAYIARGDIYQANLAQSFEGHLQGNPADLYRALKKLNPGPFMGIFQGRGFTLVSSSPERLVAGREGRLEARPIAGTRPRGPSVEEDGRLKEELRTDEKEKAEHLMLLDLARNDLGRIAEYGTVEVREFAAVESYAKVHHLVSIVEAGMRSGISMSAILKAVFPGGTITGCPKVRCMEIIRELEGRPRGFYTGSMGYIALGPCFDLNILIRTFTFFSDGRVEFFAGAGIVADSNPEREYLETLYKVEALAAALGTSLLGGE